MRRIRSRPRRTRAAHLVALLSLAIGTGCDGSSLDGAREHDASASSAIPENTLEVLSATPVVVALDEDTSARIALVIRAQDESNVVYTVSRPAHGVVTGDAPPFEYTPDADYAGDDAFELSVSDGTSSLIVQVLLTIAPVDDAPVAADVSVKLPQNTSREITLSASDVEGDALVFTWTQPEHGALSGTAPYLTYTPAAGYEGADSFTFSASDGALDSDVATVTLAVEHVGHCGDGATDQGEECDDGGTTAGDGCGATCRLEPFVTAAPVRVNGAIPNCTTAVASAARKVAVDGNRVVYVGMTCGSAAYVAVSHDLGATYGAPLSLSGSLPGAPAIVSQLAVTGTASGITYAAMILQNGAVYLRSTLDAGRTWSAAVAVGTATNSTAGLALEASNDVVYVGFRSNAGVHVARNVTRGVGPFETTDVAMTLAFFDLAYDVSRGTLVVAADSPSFRVRTSNDGGVTFGAAANPPGTEYFSDWALGDGVLFAVGSNLALGGNATQMYIMPSERATISTSVSGLPAVNTRQGRSVAANTAGDAFVASTLNDGAGIQLDRLQAGASAFSAPRLLSATGSAPVVYAPPGGNGAVVAYTVGSDVYASVQVY